MAVTTERTVVFARSIFTRDTRFLDGVKGGEPEYGQVEIVSKTIFERRAEGDVGRLLETWDREEVLATLNTSAAEHLTTTLVKALVASLQIVEPYHTPKQEN